MRLFNLEISLRNKEGIRRKKQRAQQDGTRKRGTPSSLLGQRDRPDINPEKEKEENS